jgi:hypothetical protein
MKKLGWALAVLTLTALVFLASLWLSPTADDIAIADAAAALGERRSTHENVGMVAVVLLLLLILVLTEDRRAPRGS